MTAQILVIGTGAAFECYNKTKLGDKGRASTIRLCEDALSKHDLSFKDRTSTHVNVGVLYMRRNDNENAQRHYKKAIELRPSMAEIYINYGASLIHVDNDLKQALVLKPEWTAALKALESYTVTKQSKSN